jgi:diaminohydroxyphosphoribosylaminopyrimidine deaminase / 5-amino-6-(5-phosphoribosylamino)uracil reductase
MPLSECDRHWLREAVALAQQGRWTCSPNPMVGAVVVRNGACIGKGYHHHAGGPHAEINALCEAGRRARGATLYVTLEPCCTHGRTPPCTDAIAQAGIGCVVVGAVDPNPAHQGKGLRILRSKGVKVVLARDHDAESINEIFNHFMTTGLPFVHAKWAMTLDGKIATRSGDAKWISCEASRVFVHRLRSQHDAIMVGIRTILADNPRLDVRLAGDWRQPVKVIVDSRCRTPLKARVLKGAPVIIACGAKADRARMIALKNAGAQVVQLPCSGTRKVNLRALLSHLQKKNITSVFVEGGGTLLGSFFDKKLVQRVTAFIAPKIAGGMAAPSPVAGSGIASIAKALDLEDVQICASGVDVMVTGRLKRSRR